MTQALTVYRRSELEGADFDVAARLVRSGLLTGVRVGVLQHALRIMEFWSHVDTSSGNGCWLWTGPLTNKGYGWFSYFGKRWSTHRLAWTITNGPIPDGLVILHECDTPRCVRPLHLSPGTRKDNSQDMVRKGRARGKHSGQRICKNGHPLVGQNIRLVSGGRRCWPCFLEWQRKYRKAGYG